MDGPVWREIILGGLIAALVVREPHLADRRHLLKPWSIATSVGQRCACALAILLSVGLATRALDDVARLWVFAWAATWTAWWPSRWALLGYTDRLCTRGEFRETVAGTGAPDLADRLAANLSNDAEIVVVIDDLDDVMDGIIYPALAKLQELTGLGMIDTATLAGSPPVTKLVASFVEHPMAIQVNITICNEPWSAEKLEYRPEAEWLFFEKNHKLPPRGACSPMSSLKVVFQPFRCQRFSRCQGIGRTFYAPLANFTPWPPRGWAVSAAIFRLDQGGPLA